MFSSCSWSSDSLMMGPLLLLAADEDDGGGLVEAAEDGRELFLAEERCFIAFIVLTLELSLFSAPFSKSRFLTIVLPYVAGSQAEAINRDELLVELSGASLGVIGIESEALLPI